VRAHRWAGLALALTLLVATVDVALLLWRSPDPDPPAAAPSPTERPTESLEQQVARVAGVVERIRGLTFPELPLPTYLSRDQLGERIAAFLDEYGDEQAEVDRRILELLGALPRGYDLRAGLTALLSEQVAGFYDPVTGELVVAVAQDGRRLSPLEELFLAHELEHALADATLGLPGEPDVPQSEDAALARSALIEGDATLTMQEYVSVGLSVLDQIRLAVESLGTLRQFEALDQVPWALRRSLELPYVEGLAFVTHLRDRGGWQAVDAAYARPPASTAQILFPERYDAGGEPVSPPDAGSLAAPWSQRARTSFGAADLLFLLEAPGDDRTAALDSPREHVAAWAGGALTLWTNDQSDRDAVALVLVARTPAGELCDTVTAWYLRAFPDVDPAGRSRSDEVLAADGVEQDAVVRCEGEVVRVGIAPDLQTARAAAG